MLWIRFKRWTYLTPLAPHVALCASGRRYLWSNQDAGVAVVTHKADAEELLEGTGGIPSAYEVAWEKYGVAFDAAGKVVEPQTSSETSCNHSESTVSLTPPRTVEVEEPVRRGPGRPRKR